MTAISSSFSSIAVPEPSGAKGKFPSRLHHMLDNAEAANIDHIASWLPCGRAFAIHDQKEFFNTVMPTYFPGMASYKSFRRQLALYGIYQKRRHQDPPHSIIQDNKEPTILTSKGKSSIPKRSRVGAPTGVYSHPLLVRGDAQACRLFMRRKNRSIPTTSSAVEVMRDTVYLASTSSSSGFNHDSVANYCVSPGIPVEGEQDKTDLSTVQTRQADLVTTDQIVSSASSPSRPQSPQQDYSHEEERRPGHKTNPFSSTDLSTFQPPQQDGDQTKPIVSACGGGNTSCTSSVGLKSPGGGNEGYKPQQLLAEEEQHTMRAGDECLILVRKDENNKFESSQTNPMVVLLESGIRGTRSDISVVKNTKTTTNEQEKEFVGSRSLLPNGVRWDAHPFPLNEPFDYQFVQPTTAEISQKNMQYDIVSEIIRTFR